MKIPEIIQNIEEVIGVDCSGDCSDDSYRNEYDGFKITTNKQEILFLIDNSIQCCEEWGTITSDDLDSMEVSELKGAELLEVSVIVGEDYRTIKLFTDKNIDFLSKALYVTDDDDDLDLVSSDIKGAVFINLKTSKRDIQFAVYNNHNGFYGHEVKFRCNEFKRFPENTTDSFTNATRLTWI